MMAWPNIWAQRMNPVSFPQMGIPQHPMLPAQSMMRYPTPGFGGSVQPMPVTAGIFNQSGPMQQPRGPVTYPNPFMGRMF